MLYIHILSALLVQCGPWPSNTLKQEGMAYAPEGLCACIGARREQDAERILYAHSSGGVPLL